MPPHSSNPFNVPRTFPAVAESFGIDTVNDTLPRSKVVFGAA